MGDPRLVMIGRAFGTALLFVMAGCSTTSPQEAAGEPVSEASKKAPESQPEYTPIESEATRRYDEACVETEDILADGSVENVTRREFDQKGRLSYSSTTRGDRPSWAKRYEYDEHGHQTAISVDPETGEARPRPSRTSQGDNENKLLDEAGRLIGKRRAVDLVVRDDEGRPVQRDDGEFERKTHWKVELNFYEGLGEEGREDRLARFNLVVSSPDETPPSLQELYPKFQRDVEAGRWRVPADETLALSSAHLVEYNEEGERTGYVSWAEPDPEKVFIPSWVFENIFSDATHKLVEHDDHHTVHASIPDEFAEALKQFNWKVREEQGRLVQRFSYGKDGRLGSLIRTVEEEDGRRRHSWHDRAGRNPSSTYLANGIFDQHWSRELHEGEEVASTFHVLSFDPELERSRIPEAYRSVALDGVAEAVDPVEPERILQRRSRTQRDVHGNPIEEHTEMFTRSVHYDYDENGRLLSKKTDIGQANYIMNLNGIPDETVEHEYDEEGRKIRTVEHSTDRRRTKQTKITTYEYDAEGRMLRANHTIKRGDADTAKPAGHTAYTYDDQGRTSRITEQPAGNAPALTTEHFYDEEGRLIEEKSRPSGPHGPGLIRSYSYDEDGRLTEESLRFDDDDKLTWRRVYEYDGDTLKRSRTYGSKTARRGRATLRPQHITTYIHDDAGQLVEELKSTPTQKTYSYKCRENGEQPADEADRLGLSDDASQTARERR